MRFIWVGIGLLLLTSCFSMDRSGGIMGYHKGTAKTGFGRFDVAVLPAPWKSPNIRLKQLIHENDVLKATIVTDALCGPKYDDAPLPRLAAEFFNRLDDSHIIQQKKTTLDGRQALRVYGRGRLDGVPLLMDVVVMKKDFCLYDIVYFAPPETFHKGTKDFGDYLSGFATR